MRSLLIREPQHFDHADDLNRPVDHCAGRQHDSRGRRYAFEATRRCWFVHAEPQENPIHRPEAATMNHTDSEAIPTALSVDDFRVL